MAKKKRPSFKDCSRDWQDNLVKRLFETVIPENSSAAAIGLDMAAQEANWGLCLITLDANYDVGNLRLLLPHRATIDGFTQHCPMKPTLAYLRQMLDGLRTRNITTAIAVDVPLGWPSSHGNFTKEWSATLGTQHPLPARSDFEYRMTDLCLREKLGASLFSVGADKIASAAFQWAKSRTELGSLVDACDVGFGTQGVPLVTQFETYPAAFVRLNYSEWIDYKSGENSSRNNTSARSAEQLRYELVDRLRSDYSLDVTDCQSYLDQACSAPRSDAFDGFLSALNAWDYLRSRKYGAESHQTTSPDVFTDELPTEDERRLIESEGWILCRMSPLADVNRER